MASTEDLNQTGDLEAANAAQISLHSFTIPSFPPEAQHLRALTLTSDIKLDEYQSLLGQPFSIPCGQNIKTIADTCPNIESLTLELFSLGYPPGFLTTLATSVVPNIKALTIFSQLVGGITSASQDDAVDFFARLPFLRSLHLLDVFARPGFWSRIARHFHPHPHRREAKEDGDDRRIDEAHPIDDSGAARKGLLALEVNYTTQHSDPEFLSKMHPAELPLLISPGLISLSLNVSESEAEVEPSPTASESPLPSDDESKPARDGVMTSNKTHAGPLVKALTEDGSAPRTLKALNTTLYTLTPADLGRVMARHTGLMVMAVTLEVEDAGETRKAISELMGRVGREVEQLEVVVSPSLGFYMQVNKVPSTALADAFPTKVELVELVEQGCKLQSLKVSVFRSRFLQRLEFHRKDGEWHGGLTLGQGEKEGERRQAVNGAVAATATAAAGALAM